MKGDRRGVSGFAVEPLGDMVAVGAVHPRSVRLWARAPGATGLVVEITEPSATPSEPHQRAEITRPVNVEADHTVAFTVPDDAPGLGPLSPNRRYGFRVLRPDGAVVGEGGFRTAPDDADRVDHFAFAFASCHQPFDAKGRVSAESVRMLASVERVVRDHDVRFLLMVGDQIYADYPPSRSLFGDYFAAVAPAGRASVLDCTREEVRALYHGRHRVWLGVEAFRRLLSCVPSYPMLDDHEIRDNFGSDPEHSSPRWSALRAGARDAYYDYQAARVLERSEAESSFHHSFVHGPVGVFVMDLRSERATTDESMSVYSTGQLAALQRFLETHGALPVIALVVTVPVAYIEAWLTAIAMAAAGQDSDAADRWSNPKALVDRNRLLRVLRDHARAHPAQRLVMLSGDIHVGCLFRIDWVDGAPALHQFTSSAISHVQSSAARTAAEGLAKTVHGMFGSNDLAASVSVVGGEGRNPYGGLNIGIVEITAGTETTLRFKLVGAADEDGNARIVFDSGPV